MSMILDFENHQRLSRDHAPVPDVTVEHTTNESFLAKVLDEPSRAHFVSDSDLSVVTWHDPEYVGTRFDNNKLSYAVPTTSLVIQAMHGAFTGHKYFALSPDVVWYMITNSVATHVKQNSDHYASLFTATPGTSQTIIVRDDSLRYDAPSAWNRTLPMFYDKLVEVLGQERVALFVPKFSTTTETDKIAALVSLMDTVSSYYKYEVHTKCLIPKIKLEGTGDDWKLLYKHAQELASIFTGLEAYFEDLLPVLHIIYCTAAGLELHIGDFWESMYKYKSGSGNAYVSGWITAFFAFTETAAGPVPRESFDWHSLHRSPWNGLRNDSFSSHISRVPFIWDYFGTRYPMTFAAGVTGVKWDNEFLVPQLGYGVYEV